MIDFRKMSTAKFCENQRTHVNIVEINELTLKYRFYRFPKLVEFKKRHFYVCYA